MSYDRAITVFSPDGHLFQVEYAGEAVRKGLCAVGVRGKECVVLAVEKPIVQKLQDSRTVRKIVKVDDHIFLTYAGMSADARVLINKAQLQCQAYRLNYDDRMEVDFLAKFVGEVQQKSTQKGGSRPYAVGTIIAGFNSDGTPQLWQTEPSGMTAAWRACVLGKKSKTVHEEMEKDYVDGMANDAALKFAVKSVLEVAESGGKNIEVMMMTKAGVVEVDDKELDALVKVLEKEREEARAKKRAAAEES